MNTSSTVESETLRNPDLRAIIEHFRQSTERSSNTSLYDDSLGLFRSFDLSMLKQISCCITSGLRTALRNAHAERYFDRLLKLGVQEETFVPVLFLFQLLPAIEGTLRNLLGEPPERKRKAKALRDAARVMDEFASLFPASADEIARQGANSNFLFTPKLTADSLHLYANMLSAYEQFREALDVNSGQEIAKYSFAAAVKRITNKYHDREVSGITGVLLGKPDYDETAHRVWRRRTQSRLGPTCSALPILIHAFNSALTKNNESGPIQGSADR